MMWTFRGGAAARVGLGILRPEAEEGGGKPAGRTKEKGAKNAKKEKIDAAGPRCVIQSAICCRMATRRVPKHFANREFPCSPRGNLGLVRRRPLKIVRPNLTWRTNLYRTRLHPAFPDCYR